MHLIINVHIKNAHSAHWFLEIVLIHSLALSVFHCVSLYWMDVFSYSWWNYELGLDSAIGLGIYITCVCLYFYISLLDPKTIKIVWDPASLTNKLCDLKNNDMNLISATVAF